MAPLIGLTTGRVTRQKSQGDLAATPFSYIKAVSAAGGLPVLIPLGLPEEQLRALFHRLHGVLLIGGSDIDPSRFGGEPHPRVYDVDGEQDDLDISMVRWSAEQGKPFFGICRGIQAINVALGGGLYTDIADQFGTIQTHDMYRFPDIPRNHLAHPVRLEDGSALAGILGGVEFQVNSLHHQGLSSVADSLQIVGHASDGLVEAVELREHPFGIGVQWHPEWLQEHEPQRALFRAFVRACEAV
jgi:putative glutamine amidotransferase